MACRLSLTGKREESEAGTSGAASDKKKNEQAFRGFTIHGQTGDVPESHKRKKQGDRNQEVMKRRKGSPQVDLSAEQAAAMSALLKFGEGQSSHGTGKPSNTMESSEDAEEIQALLSSAGADSKALSPAAKPKFKPRYASSKVDEPIWASMGRVALTAAPCRNFLEKRPCN